MRIKRTFFCLLSTMALLPLVSTGVVGDDDSPSSEEEKFNRYPSTIGKYFKQLYHPSGQKYAFKGKDSREFKQWQVKARQELVKKMGLEKIKESVGEFTPKVELDNPSDEGDYLRQKGVIETEPGVKIPFWLLKPKGKGPFPLGVFPHGHDARGHHTSAGVYQDENHKKKSLAEDRDVAVQAVKLGFFAIAPAVRGLSTTVVPDLNKRHGGRACRSHAMHCLLAGRTATGERVWDMQKILDWALKQKEVDSKTVLMMGNSGGGMITLFTAAVDARITIAVPSCSYAPTLGQAGYIFHCDCNMIPGLHELGGLPSVAGLIAPRYLLAVNGRKDSLHSVAEIERAVKQTQALYNAAGAPGHFQHRFGSQGHRFYKDLMWPFVKQCLDALSS